MALVIVQRGETESHPFSGGGLTCFFTFGLRIFLPTVTGPTKAKRYPPPAGKQPYVPDAHVHHCGSTETHTVGPLIPLSPLTQQKAPRFDDASGHMSSYSHAGGGGWGGANQSGRELCGPQFSAYYFSFFLLLSSAGRKICPPWGCIGLREYYSPGCARGESKSKGKEQCWLAGVWRSDGWSLEG